MNTVIAIANQKGGVGKTTTAVTLAHGLALKGKSVLLVDLDPQGQCATALGVEQAPGVFHLLIANQDPNLVVRPTGRERLQLLPGDKQTSVAQIVLTAQQQPVSLIAERLRPLAKSANSRYIIFDTAPSVGGLQEQALWAASLVLIPCAVDFLSAEGVGKIVETMDVLRQRAGWSGSLLGVLPTFYDEVTRESLATLDDLRKAFGEAVLPPVHRATILRECAAEGKTVFEVDGQSRAALEYSSLVHRVLEVT